MRNAVVLELNRALSKEDKRNPVTSGTVRELIRTWGPSDQGFTNSLTRLMRRSGFAKFLLEYLNKDEESDMPLFEIHKRYSLVEESVERHASQAELKMLEEYTDQESHARECFRLLLPELPKREVPRQNCSRNKSDPDEVSEQNHTKSSLEPSQTWKQQYLPFRPPSPPPPHTDETHAIKYVLLKNIGVRDKTPHNFEHPPPSSPVKTFNQIHPQILRYGERVRSSTELPWISRNLSVLLTAQIRQLCKDCELPILNLDSVEKLENEVQMMFFHRLAVLLLRIAVRLEYFIVTAEYPADVDAFLSELLHRGRVPSKMLWAMPRRLFTPLYLRNKPAPELTAMERPRKEAEREKSTKFLQEHLRVQNERKKFGAKQLQRLAKHGPLLGMKIYRQITTIAVPQSYFPDWDVDSLVVEDSLNSSASSLIEIDDDDVDGSGSNRKAEQEKEDEVPEGEWQWDSKDLIRIRYLRVKKEYPLKEPEKIYANRKLELTPALKQFLSSGCVFQPLFFYHTRDSIAATTIAWKAIATKSPLLIAILLELVRGPRTVRGIVIELTAFSPSLIKVTLKRALEDDLVEIINGERDIVLCRKIEKEEADSLIYSHRLSDYIQEVIANQSEPSKMMDVPDYPPLQLNHISDRVKISVRQGNDENFHQKELAHRRYLGKCEEYDCELREFERTEVKAYHEFIRGVKGMFVGYFKRRYVTRKDYTRQEREGLERFGTELSKEFIRDVQRAKPPPEFENPIPRIQIRTPKEPVFALTENGRKLTDTIKDTPLKLSLKSLMSKNFGGSIGKADLILSCMQDGLYKLPPPPLAKYHRK